MRRLLKILFILILIALVVVVGTNVWVVAKASGSIRENADDLTDARVGLVLGTSKSVKYGVSNPFFTDRMDAAAELYHSGKVKHLIVSGDNRTQYYNEPRDMMEALKQRGVPSGAITLDYAGLRTLDSVVRCKLVFEQDEFIIITQKFHASRAVFIADYYDIRVQAYTADFESKVFPALFFREAIARTLAVVDLFVLKKSPKYLGEIEKLTIE